MSGFLSFLRKKPNVTDLTFEGVVMLDSIVRKVTDSYLETAVWSSSDWDDMDDSDNPRPLDENYDANDFSDEARAAASRDCAEFLDALDNIEIDEERTLFDCADEAQGLSRIGHDLWLTRNGHGAGFWDGDYAEWGDSITEVVYDTFGRYSELYIYADSDGRLQFEG